MKHAAASSRRRRGMGEDPNGSARIHVFLMNPSVAQPVAEGCGRPGGSRCPEGGGRPGDSRSRWQRDAAGEDPAQPGAEGCGGFPLPAAKGCGGSRGSRWPEGSGGAGKGDAAARARGDAGCRGREERCRCPGPERPELLFPTSALSWKRLRSTRARPGHDDGGCRGSRAVKFPRLLPFPVPSGPCAHGSVPEVLPGVLLSSRTLTFILGA